MPVPPKRRSTSSKHRRRSHHALTKVTLVPCSKCKKPTMPHRVCRFCGTYQGREVVALKTKKKKEKK